MKQKPLTNEEQNVLVKYRIQRAKETLADADNLINNGSYNSAVNRLYYACYYSVIALLIKNGINAQTHQGVIQMFSLHFIVTNKINKKYSVFYGKLFNSRISGDYDDFVQYDAQMVNPMYLQAKEFIDIIEEEVNK